LKKEFTLVSSLNKLDQKPGGSGTAAPASAPLPAIDHLKLDLKTSVNM
jgi:hypothetical protein